MMKCTLASKDDLEEIILLAQSRIENCCETLSSLQQELDNKDFLMLVLKEKDIVNGFILIRLSQLEAEIDDFVIRLEDEKKGYGSLLIKESLQLLQEKGIQKVFLEVRKDNLKAIRCYERNGFTCYRERLNYYPDCSALCYVKELCSK